MREASGALVEMDLHFLIDFWGLDRTRTSRTLLLFEINTFEFLIKAQLNTGAGQKSVSQTDSKHARKGSKTRPLAPSPAAAEGGGAGRRVLELPERVSSRFETRFSGPGACIERCFYPHLYFNSYLLNLLGRPPSARVASRPPGRSSEGSALRRPRERLV